MKIEIECCEGNETYKGKCLQDRCPIYEKAKWQVIKSWPYERTGYGNLYGLLSHKTYLSRVRENLKRIKK